MKHAKVWLVALLCAVVPMMTACDDDDIEQDDARNEEVVGEDGSSFDERNRTEYTTQEGRNVETEPYGNSARGTDAEYAEDGDIYVDHRGTDGRGTTGDASTGGFREGNRITGTYGERNATDDVGLQRPYNPVQRLALSSSGGFDRSFLETMIRHHEQGLEMAQLAVKSAKHEDLKEFANTMVQEHQRELKRMRQWLDEWYVDTQASR